MSQKFEVELEDNTIDDLTQQAQNLSDSYNQRRQEEANRKQQIEEEQQQLKMYSLTHVTQIHGVQKPLLKKVNQFYQAGYKTPPLL